MDVPHFSEPVLEALLEVVTGGPGMAANYKRVGCYRTGPQLEAFLGDVGIPLSVGSESRLPSVREALRKANWEPEGYGALVQLMERATDPRLFLDDPEEEEAAVGYLNERLYFDDLELRKKGKTYKLEVLYAGSEVASKLHTAAETLNWDSVVQDLKNAQTMADKAPYQAVSSACTTLESVCKTMLDEMGEPYPKKQTLKNLCQRVQENLGLSPGKNDLPDHIQDDVKRVLSGLISIGDGIAALRTHAGDVHGKGKDDPRPNIDPRIAHLAIDAISNLGLFYLRTWERRNFYY